MKDIENNIKSTQRARWLAKYQKVFCSSIVVIVFLLCILAYMIWPSKDTTVSSPVERLLQEHKEETAVDHPPHGNGRFLGAILSAKASVFEREEDIADDFWTPCRRLSSVEMQTNDTLEGHALTDILMTMCRILHDRVGCDGEGALAAKLIDITPWLNVCIITYKGANSTCHHLLNPVLHPSARPTGDKVEFRHWHFPYAGTIIATREPQVLVTYNSVDDEYKQVTQGFGKNQSLYLQDSYDILMGNLPPPRLHSPHPPIPSRNE